MLYTEKHFRLRNRAGGRWRRAPRSNPSPLLLPVHLDRFAAGELSERSIVTPAREAQENAVMPHAFPLDARAHAYLRHQIGGELLQDPARTRSIKYSPLRLSTMTESIPFKFSRCPNNSPAGPAPIIPTCVCVRHIYLFGSSRSARREQDLILLERYGFVIGVYEHTSVKSRR